jgi:4'-phosphopantetheinyl transferase EntD
MDDAHEISRCAEENLTRMIEQILPAGVAVVEAFEDDPSEAVFPGEEYLIGSAVEKRRREFITTRRCAREALAMLGFAPIPIHSGSAREPQWPIGVVGSITHTTNFRAAAVAPQNVVASIGIDAEPDSSIPDDIVKAIAIGSEPEMLAELTRAFPAIHWGRILFSAKEAVYKAWYPLTRRWLGFEDARLTLDPSGTFLAELLVDGTRVAGGPPLTELRGRFLIARGLIATVAVDVRCRAALG